MRRISLILILLAGLAYSEDLPKPPTIPLDETSSLKLDNLSLQAQLAQSRYDSEMSRLQREFQATIHKLTKGEGDWTYDPKLKLLRKIDGDGGKKEISNGR